MKITNVEIENFRGLEKIGFNVEKPIAVIVGPNAIGKSTIFEAIRFLKVVLLPTAQGETESALQLMGAYNPNLRRVELANIVKDKSKDLSIKIEVSISDSELNLIEKRLNAIAQSRLLNSLGMQVSSQLHLVQYLSTPEGLDNLKKISESIKPEFEKLKTSKRLVVHLIHQRSTGQLRGLNIFHQDVFRNLMEAIPPTESYINYIPADRSIPRGEVNVQLGQSEVANILMSHIARPDEKFKKLKQYIINQHVLTGEGSRSVKDDFNLIFSNLLPGKSFGEVKISRSGKINVLIKEDKTGFLFDIDNMSSGEKGLLLSFFIMLRSTVKGGIVLIDEPELHLNPSVCKRILPFLYSEIVSNLQCQVILCTHSPEILSQAYERTDCELLHLISPTDITPLMPGDKEEFLLALNKLGSTTQGILASKGGLFVEGVHDVELLEHEFSELLSGYKINSLGGRGEVEKEIKNLQRLSSQGKGVSGKFIFIFDNDRKPTSLQSDKNIRVIQWDRYCFENYLIDAVAIYDSLKEFTNGLSPDVTRGNLSAIIKELALSQLPKVIIREAFEKFKPEDCVLTKRELSDVENYQEASRVMEEKVKTSLAHIQDINISKLKSDFEVFCNTRENELKNDWDSSWKSKCDGKQLLIDIINKFPIRIHLLAFKKDLLTRVVRNNGEESKLLLGTLKSLLEN